MAQPVWITPVGSLGVIPESQTYRYSVVAVDPDGNDVTYSVISGTLPHGIQFSPSGLVSGIPNVVSSDVVSRFTVRASTTTLPRRISDRTFSLTITGNDTPVWNTPSGSIGTYYSGDRVSFQFSWIDDDPADIVEVKLATGQLPAGLSLTPTGLLYGYCQPAKDLTALPGYSNTGQDVYPYDFVAGTVNKNYEFTLELTDGVNSELRTFTLFVYTRQGLTADNTIITADNSIVTADETNRTAPFLTNADPSDLGIFRSSNYFAYQFIGESYTGSSINYAVSVNQGYGSPPGIELDTNSGWYYGYVPDQGATEVTYSFNIVAYESQFVGTPITCTQTTFGTNVITCTSTTEIKVGQPLIFTGTAFGGVVADPRQIYYVSDIVSKTKFKVSLLPNSTNSIDLTSASGTMQANLITASEPYPFTLTIIGVVSAGITWLTDSDLGVIDNGDTSRLYVQAVNSGGRSLLYKLKSGGYNSLPQGLELLPTGDISGRVTFNGFALDLGATTFDESYSNNRNITSLGTTFDSTFRFTINAYAPDSLVPLYKVRSITVTNGGSGYDPAYPPTIRFTTPIGASAVVAEAGNVVIAAGAIVSVDVTVAGDGYTEPPTISILDSRGGSGAILTPVMQLSGSKDMVSVYKEFHVRVYRRWNKPYQNLLLRAMPPLNDRATLYDFLHDETIFVPEWIYRPSDPFFGMAKNVTFVQAYGLLPETLDVYVSSLYQNHYWKNLVLGPIKTARAVDASGNVVYEVVYSEIIDNLVNNDGVSISKIVNLAYPVLDPADPTQIIRQVYPNSLVDMRTQMVNGVGLVGNCGDLPLPLWMTSKQANNRVLGYVPAWVIAYTVPGRSNEIAYYINTKWQGHLNDIDFDVDRYILDCELSRHWDPAIQQWVPNPGTLTTFDRYSFGEPVTFLQNVDIATELAFVDINQRTLGYINSLGGLDGLLSQINGNTLIFPKQENYEPPLPGNYPAWSITMVYPDSIIVEHNDLYYTALHDVPAGIDINNLYYWYPGINTDAAWQNYRYPFDTYAYSQLPARYDDARTVPGGDHVECYETISATNLIVCDDTYGLAEGQEIVFTDGIFGGVVAGQIYYVLEILSPVLFSITETPGGVTPVALTDGTGTMIARAADERMGIWTINLDPVTQIVTLVLTVQTDPLDWVQVQRGVTYAGAQLYYPTSVEPGFKQVAWQPLVQVPEIPTTFDGDSMQFTDPVDMYDPTDNFDKYLVFPYQNILGNPPIVPDPHVVGWVNEAGNTVSWTNNVDSVVQWVNV